MDPVHESGPWTPGPCFVLTPTFVLHNYRLISMKHDNPDSCLLNIRNFPNQEEHLKLNSEFK